MKKIVFLASLVFASYTYAQAVNLGSQPVNVDNRNTFLDASEFTFSDTNISKGLNFPRTDLTAFAFDISELGEYQYFRTAFDGLIVYNTGKGKTGDNAETQGIKVDVEPGFYYFSNPEGNEETKDVSKGKWIRIGSGEANAKLIIKQDPSQTQSPAVVTNTNLDDKDVYAVKGTFTNTAGNTVTIAKPEGFSRLYNIKMYRKDQGTDVKQLVGTSLYSYRDVTEGSETKLKLVFGNGVMSTAYPQGEYEYVLEYIK